ncbi:unnamed protein product [Peronospora farinosa]|uniref:Uncharacterized protein n=1 Tax=Peronospora farinosa TaxID=134698 RepID=A0AAV0TNB6_9STRA|nr:unnamed protein product [Peronospora farinosa]
MVEQKVFQRHEAHEISTPLLMLRLFEQNNITLNAPPNASMMLDGNERCRAVWVPTICASMTLERRAAFLTFAALPTVLVARCYDYLRTKFYSMCTLAHLPLKLRV